MTVPRFYGGCHNKFIQKPAVYFGSPGGELSAQRTEGWLPTQGLRQHRTIPALRLKHRSGSCGTASALPKCSIMSGCGTRIVLRGKAPRTLRPLPLLRSAVSATGGAHLCSIQYYLRFWLSICRTSLAVSALRIMRYCPKNSQNLRQAPGLVRFTPPYPPQIYHSPQTSNLSSSPIPNFSFLLPNS